MWGSVTRQLRPEASELFFRLSGIRPDNIFQ